MDKDSVQLSIGEILDGKFLILIICILERRIIII
jgi:hypothetical protein